MLRFNPTYTSTTDKHGVGNVYWGPDGKAYKWVQCVDLAAVANNYALPANTTGTAGTIDVSGGSAIGTKPFGVWLTAVAVSSYGFIQVAGVVDVYSDGSVAAGESVVAHATVNGQVDTMAAGSEHLVIGKALADDATNGTIVVAPVLLQGLI